MSSDLVLKGHIPPDDLPAIAERYRAGESLVSIGRGYGVSNEAVRQRLEKWAIAGHGDAAYQELVTDYLVENAIQAKDTMATSTDALGLARAREEVRYWLWMLERRRPRTFGQKVEKTEDTTIRVIIARDIPQQVVEETKLPVTVLAVPAALENHSREEE